MANQDNQMALIQQKYKGCNLLLPVSTEIQMNPFYKYTVMEVSADVSANSGDIFKVGSTKVGYDSNTKKDIYADVFSPAKPLVMKLASAAGIQFDPSNTFGTYLSKNCYKAKAYGAMRLPDGTGKTHCDEKVINLDDEEDRFRLEFMDKSLQGITDEKQAAEAARLFNGHWIDAKNKWGKPCKAYVIDASDRQNYIDRGVLVNMTLLRKTFAEKAMTGAILRVVRALIGLKGMYTLEELKKPFAIPRVTFSPDYSDPSVRAAMISQGMSSVSNMFGTVDGLEPPALVAPTAEFQPQVDAFNPEEFADNAAFASDGEVVEIDAEEMPVAAPPPVRAVQAPSPVAQQSQGQCVCAMCNAKITPKVEEFSMRKFKQPLCMNCQKEAL